MNKCVWITVVVFLWTGVCAADEQGFPLVSGICLVENEVYQRGLPPGKITIGMQVRTDTLFKISFGDRVLQAGLFRKGFNTIALPSTDFFRKTDTYTFILGCKSGESVVDKEIVIDIRLVPLYVVQKMGEEKKQHVYTLSFLIGDRLIYSTRKFSLSDISFKLELPPWEGIYNPFGLIDRTQKPVSGIPILGAVAGLYHLAMSLSPAKDINEENIVPQKKQQIETTFLKTNVAGDLWQWKALIFIKTIDLEKDPIPIP
ncbi:MAG: hypothetical protein V3S65_09390 [Candidatus Aminicenantaceae bacterium]